MMAAHHSITAMTLASLRHCNTNIGGFDSSYVSAMREAGAESDLPIPGKRNAHKRHSTKTAVAIVNDWT